MKSFVVIVATLIIVFGSMDTHAQQLQFTPDDVLRSSDLNSLVNAMTGANTAPSPIIPVDCTAGQRIGDVLPQALPGSTLQISGTCNETVTITTDRITLDGQGTAIIDGGGGSQDVILVEGAQGVTITGVIVQNGRRGIRGTLGASLRLTSVTAQNNNVIIDSNGGEGIRLDRNATAIFSGTIVSNSNANDGILIFQSSSALFDTTSLVQANNNGDRGIQVSQASSIVFFNVGIVEAQNNGADGLRAAESSSIVVSNNADVGPATIRMNTNGGDGVEASRAAAILLVGANFIATGNGRGISLAENATMTFAGLGSGPATTALIENSTNEGIGIREGAFLRASSADTFTVQNNGGSGIRVADGGNLTLNNATISGNNDGGIELSNGASANLSNIQITNHANAFAALFLTQASATANTLTITNNGGRGISLDSHASLTMDNATLTANGDTGIALFNGSAAQLVNVQITNHATAFAAIQISSNSSVVNFSSLPEIGVTVSDNGGIGVLVGPGSVFDAGSSVITNNTGDGMQVDGGQINISNATLTGNGGGVDLNASFGARLDFAGGNTIGAITCDGTVLSRGDATCP